MDDAGGFSEVKWKMLSGGMSFRLGEEQEGEIKPIKECTAVKHNGVCVLL